MQGTANAAADLQRRRSSCRRTVEPTWCNWRSCRCCSCCLTSSCQEATAVTWLDQMHQLHQLLLLLLPRRQGPVLSQLSPPMQLLLNCCRSMCSSCACFRISAFRNLTMPVLIVLRLRAGGWIYQGLQARILARKHRSGSSSVASALE
jgi:hypothetical protein